MLKKINATLGDFERGVGVRLRTVGVRQCDRRRCPAHLTCSDVYKPENKQIRFMSDEMSYISYEHSRSHACICKDGSGGWLGRKMFLMPLHTHTNAHRQTRTDRRRPTQTYMDISTQTHTIMYVCTKKQTNKLRRIGHLDGQTDRCT